MIFTIELGKMRECFGIMIGQIAKEFGLDAEDMLAEIIPE